MISKSRLEELIEQGATIYRTSANCGVLEYKLDKTYVKVDNAFLWKKLNGAIKSVMHPLDQIFETKEEAEWYREFGCIERTERLELPTYEEFIELNRHDNCFSFLTKYNERCCILIGNDIYMHNDMPKPKDEWTIVIHNEDDEYIFEKLLTKENYTLACRKAKELFLGEKE